MLDLICKTHQSKEIMSTKHPKTSEQSKSYPIIVVIFFVQSI